MRTATSKVKLSAFCMGSSDLRNGLHVMGLCVDCLFKWTIGAGGCKFGIRDFARKDPWNEESSTDFGWPSFRPWRALAGGGLE